MLSFDGGKGQQRTKEIQIIYNDKQINTENGRAKRKRRRGGRWIEWRASRDREVTVGRTDKKGRSQARLSRNDDDL